jgi:poly(hydroxyalkanoate) granule-associated protein
MDTNTNSGKNLQDELMESAHRIWLAGLGALATAEAEGSKVFSKLVERGKDVEAKGKEQAAGAKEQFKSTVENVKSQATDAWSDLSDKLDEKLTAALHRLGVPTREEIRSLTLKIEELNAKVDLLRPRVTPATPVAGEPTIVTPTGEPLSEA